MSKDPAFLFYSKDWLTDTAEMLPREKGVFIDLLCFQHQYGSLPRDVKRLARLVRLSEDEFNEIWQNIQSEFIETPNGIPNGKPKGEATAARLINPKLKEMMNDRTQKARKNKIIGTFAHVLKKLNLNEKQVQYLKNQFNINEFIKDDTEWDTERLINWCTDRLKNGTPIIEDANENEDAIENEEENKRVNNEVNIIVDYLNQKTNKDFKPKTKPTKEKIQARLNEGFTVEDFKKVIDTKVAEWKDDPKMDAFLRPQTLFNTKFEAYLNQKQPVNNAKHKNNLRRTASAQRQRERPANVID
jgi:uncharacterized phage protein (TIGR02220 family)